MRTFNENLKVFHIKWGRKNKFKNQVLVMVIFRTIGGWFFFCIYMFYSVLRIKNIKSVFFWMEIGFTCNNLKSIFISFSYFFFCLSNVLIYKSMSKIQTSFKKVEENNSSHLLAKEKNLYKILYYELAMRHIIYIFYYVINDVYGLLCFSTLK